MIVVKIELWPRGRQVGAKEIGRMYVANDGAGTRDTGNYKVAVCRRGSDAVPREIYSDEQRALIEDENDKLPKAARAGEVKDYPRLAYNVWRLIGRSILAAFPEEDRAPKQRRVVFDRLVTKGFAMLAMPLRHAMKQFNGPVGLPPGEDGEALHAALEWLDAASRDDL